jgi:hypothetical protein
MDSDNLNMVEVLVVGNHHQGSTTLVVRFHHCNVTQAMMVVISLLALTVDSGW